MNYMPNELKFWFKVKITPDCIADQLIEELNKPREEETLKECRR